jgi:hypothetical protein
MTAEKPEGDVALLEARDALSRLHHFDQIVAHVASQSLRIAELERHLTEAVVFADAFPFDPMEVPLSVRRMWRRALSSGQPETDHG